MTPKMFLVLVAALIMGAAVLVLGEDVLSGVFDKDLQNDLAAELGITKQGRQRPSD